MKFKLYLALALMTTSNIVSAQYTCTGKIERINQGYNGNISVVSSSIYGDTQGRTICSLNAERNGVSIETCKGWLSKLLSHEARGVNITIQYNDATTSCDAQPAWSAAGNPWALW